MGFTIYYRSTRPVSETETQAIKDSANRASEGRTWLGCEPVDFFPRDVEGFLEGGSKPNFQPHPDDAAAAASEGLPDGTTRDLLDVLCALSREHNVDWALRHEHDPEVVGFIRDGVCDDSALARIEAFSDLADILGELDLEDEFR